MPGLLALIEGDLPSGRYSARALAEATRERGARVTLPPVLEAAEPPEARGLARDAVRLMVARDGARSPTRGSSTCPRFLRAGDLLVVNESATLPAALDARARTGRRWRCTSRRRSRRSAAR